MRDTVLAAIEDVRKSADPDELAFLALTSKIEFPFRDRLAFALSRRASLSGARVAREYKRADVAWLVAGSPPLLLEFKACYTRDPITQPDVYIGHLLSDLAKAGNLGGPGCARMAILLATHPTGPIPSALYDTIKYAGKVNAVIKQVGGADAVRRKALEAVEMRRSRFSQITPFALNLGTYLGIGVELLGWAVEPTVEPAT